MVANNIIYNISKFFERDSAAKVDSNFQGGRVEALLHHGSTLRMLNHSTHMVSLSAWFFATNKL